MEQHNKMSFGCMRYDPVAIRTMSQKMNGTPVFTIYQNPIDFPRCIVVRMQYVSRNNTGAKIYFDSAAVVVDTIAEARKMLPISELGLVRLLPSEDDEACIVESWL